MEKLEEVEEVEKLEEVEEVEEVEEMQEEVEKGEGQRKAASLLGQPTNRYHKMLYAKVGAWAVRQRFFPKMQLFQIKAKAKSLKQVELLVDEAIQMLDGGRSEEEVKQWAKSQDH